MDDDDIQELAEGIDYALGKECQSIRDIHGTEIGEMITGAIEEKIPGIKPTEIKDIVKRMSLFIVKRRNM